MERLTPPTTAPLNWLISYCYRSLCFQIFVTMVIIKLEEENLLICVVNVDRKTKET